MFGSLARGESSLHSDLDLIVVMKTSKRFLERYDDLLVPIVSAVGRSVDLLVYTPEELEKVSHRPFIADALRHGVTILSRSKNIHEAQRWLATAGEDMRAAEVLVQSGCYAQARFPAQQWPRKQ